MQKRVLTSQATHDEIVHLVNALNGVLVHEQTREQAWDSVEKLFARGCAIRWTESGYTASWQGRDITCWEAEDHQPERS